MIDEVLNMSLMFTKSLLNYKFDKHFFSVCTSLMVI